MARAIKDNVDYFPHYCDHGKTLFIIEQHYGNDGYAFWFKLLELLGKTEGHYYDCKSTDNWEFLQAKTRFLGVKCKEILDKLALLGAIDRFLWENDRVIWSDNFLDNIADAYKNRKRPVPKKPISTVETPISTHRNPQIRKEENKEENMKENHSRAREEAPPVDNFSEKEEGDVVPSTDDNPDFIEFMSVYPRRENAGRAKEAWGKAIASGAKPALIIGAAKKYAAMVKAEGREMQYVKMPYNFILEQIPFEARCPTCEYYAQCEGKGWYTVEVEYLGWPKTETVQCPYKGVG